MTTFKIWQALLTGSRAYGTPKPTSDTDVVIRMGRDDVKMLVEAYPDCSVSKDYNTNLTHIFHFGPLNLICVMDDRVFEQWIRGTVQLKQQAPVIRDVAVEHFKTIRAKGVDDLSVEVHLDDDPSLAKVQVKDFRNDPHHDIPF